MSANQLDSYYHLELLMSLVRETKPLSTPQQTAPHPRDGGSFEGGLLSTGKHIVRHSVNNGEQVP